MSSLHRWLRFNLVGLLGAGVQLCTLSVFARCFAPHNLLISSAAIEVAVLHNFFWHRRYTWSDREVCTGLWSTLLRFHLSNGSVSLLGNALLLPILVRWASPVVAGHPGAHVAVLAANGGAILCCSLVNFVAGHGWAFRGQTSGQGAIVVGSADLP